MKRFSLLLLFPAVVFWAGCASTDGDGPALRASGNSPRWLVDPYRVYDAREYLVAAGEGRTLQEAMDTAVANLARMFRMEIRVDETLAERYRELMGTRNELQVETDLSRQTDIKVNEEILGVRFPRSATGKDGRMTVLAVLHRPGAATLYRSRVERGAERVVELRRRAGEAGRPVLRYADLSAALVVARHNQYLLDQLDVIAPGARAEISLPYEYDALERSAAEAAAKVKFDVQWNGAGREKLTQAVTEALATLGFVGDGKSAAWIVSGRMKVEEADLRRDDMAFVRYDMDLQVKNHEGATVCGISAAGREGHLSKSGAEQRAVAAAAEKVRSALTPAITSYLDSLVYTAQP